MRISRFVYTLGFIGVFLLGIVSCSTNSTLSDLETPQISKENALESSQTDKSSPSNTLKATALSSTSLDRLYKSGVHVVTTNLNNYSYPTCVSTNPSGKCTSANTAQSLSGYSYEGRLGGILINQEANTRAIYECYVDTEYVTVNFFYGDSYFLRKWGSFLSTGSNCEGRSKTGLAGYLFISPPNGIATVPVYRCLAGNVWYAFLKQVPDHFATNNPNCEGRTNEGLLGYALQ